MGITSDDIYLFFLWDQSRSGISPLLHTVQRKVTRGGKSITMTSRKKIQFNKRILSLHCSVNFTQSVISHPYNLSHPALFNETRLYGFFCHQYCQPRSKSKQANKTNNFIIIIIILLELSSLFTTAVIIIIIRRTWMRGCLRWQQCCWWCWPQLSSPRVSHSQPRQPSA